MCPGYVFAAIGISLVCWQFCRRDRLIVSGSDRGTTYSSGCTVGTVHMGLDTTASQARYGVRSDVHRCRVHRVWSRAELAFCTVSQRYNVCYLGRPLRVSNARYFMFATSDAMRVSKAKYAHCTHKPAWQTAPQSLRAGSIAGWYARSYSCSHTSKDRN
jgi:hypothetical protein